MPKLTIDGKEIEVDEGLTVLQACEIAGVSIPRFCYHDRLSIAGNCRMCLVEMEKSSKPIASCAMPVSENMVIHTDTPMVKKAREGVMEFLLINHPLDCPICDQGGECDLQDQAMSYGRGVSRFFEEKRAVKEKYMGPLIKTYMTRCIHCTRCVRFLNEVAGIEELGTIGRGEHMEVTTYVEKSLTSELSGNIIDLCPVGALTSRPYAFQARSWELTKTESIDVLDAVGSNIRVDSRGTTVMRILPRLHEDINEEWISDKTRFAYDGLRVQRLDRPMLRKDGKLHTVSWYEALTAVASKLSQTRGDKIAAIAGDLADLESMMALKDLMDSLDCNNIECRQDGSIANTSERVSYLFNTTIAGIEEADLCLLIGTNPRYEASIINARLRKRYRAGGFTIASIGPRNDLTYPVQNLGDNVDILRELLDQKHEFVRKILDAKNPMLILGTGVMTRPDAEAILALVSELAEKLGFVRDDWNGFNVLQRAASRVGALDIGFVPKESGKNLGEILGATSRDEIKIVYLLGADEIDMSKLGNSFVIYQGHHGDKGAHRADVIFPGAAYTEKSGTYINLEGRLQRTKQAVFPPGDAKEDWKIIKELSKYLNKSLSYESIEELRNRIAKVIPYIYEIDKITPTKWTKFGKAGELLSLPFENVINNYYMTDVISRASKTMAECSTILKDEKAA
ncbi:NADH-quinone oxidoreductase chain 3 [Rickettsiales bacterium Ac37b]|nr:NADH-quinone oxidoreductase chain 3 [Rickettsiales bacterium Ac37b]